MNSRTVVLLDPIRIARIGERDGELAKCPEVPVQDPIQLVWMVNKMPRWNALNPKSVSPSRQAGWGRGRCRFSGLACHLLHHRDKLDGVESAMSRCARRISSLCLIALCLFSLAAPARAQIESGFPPNPRAPVPDDPLKPLPQTDKPLIDDVGLLKEQLPMPEARQQDAQEWSMPASVAAAISRALHANPDVLLAIARLDEVRAERDRTRLKVVEQVSQAIHDMEANRDEQYSLRRRRADKTAPEQGKSEGTLQAELAGIQSHLGYLLGAGNDPPQGKSNSAKTYAEALAVEVAGNTAAALERALRSNPDLRLADAKVRGAEAELNQIRLATARKVAVAFHRRQNNTEALKWAEAEVAAGLSQMEAIHTGRNAAAESEAELLYLLGVGADAPADVPSGEAPAVSASEPPVRPSPAKRPELPKKMQEALGKKMNWMHKTESLGSALELLNSQGDVRILASNDAATMPADIGAVGEMPLLTILEMLADQTGCAFIVRDYGLLAVPRADAWQYPGAAIPSDLPLVPIKER